MAVLYLGLLDVGLAASGLETPDYRCVQARLPGPRGAGMAGWVTNGSLQPGGFSAVQNQGSLESEARHRVLWSLIMQPRVAH